MENFGFFYAFMHAGLINKLILIILLLMSIYSWTLIFQKSYQYHIFSKLHKEVRQLLATRNLEKIKEYSTQNNNLYSKIIEFIINEVAQKKDVSTVITQAEIIFSQGMFDKNNKVSNLATISNAAPFVGLLGTVLGVISSFQQIGINSSVQLAVIAPGISEALYATAFGIFVAIPATVFYNFFINKTVEYEDHSSLLVQQMIFLLQK